MSCSCVECWERRDTVRRLESPRHRAFNEAIEIVRNAPDYSDGNGLRSIDPRGLDVLVKALVSVRDAE